MASGADRRTLKAQRHADGKLRCAWCPEDPLYVAYHDAEMCSGSPDPHLFEMLCLEGAQAGLAGLPSCASARPTGAAFDDFDAETMALRRGQAPPAAAGSASSEIDPRSRHSFSMRARSRFAWRGSSAITSGSSPDGKVLRRRPLHSATIVPLTPHSDAMSKTQEKGFKFVGQLFAMPSCRPGLWMNINVVAGLPARNSLLAAALLLFCLAAPGIAQAPKPAFKPLDVFDLQWVADPEVSPDGRSIAYVRMANDIKTDRPLGSIWLVGVDGKNERPLSSASASGAPRWSPDGTRIAFLARARTDQHNYSCTGRQGAAAAISNFTNRPARWRGRRWPLACLHHARAAGTQTAQGRTAGSAQNVKWADPPKLIDKMVFRADGEGYLPNAFSQLFVVSADGGAARQLTQGDFDHQGPPAFTADGSGC